jgi:hypothetical protein
VNAAWTRFEDLFWQAGALLLSATVAGGVAALVAFLFWRRQIMSRWHRAYWLVFTQALFIPLTIGIGLLFPAHGAADGWHSNPIGEHLVDAFTVIPLVTGCYWIYRLKGVRWLAVILVVMQEFFLYLTLMIAGLSVSGEWI